MLIDYLPLILKDIREFIIICSIEDTEISTAQVAVDNFLSEQYIQTCSEYAVKRWERILRIIPNAKDNLNTRKEAIFARLGEQLPFTLRSLKSSLDVILGAGNYDLVLYNTEYRLYLRIKLNVKTKIDAVKNLLNRMVPANIILDCDLMYNRHIDLKIFNHAQLGIKTHKEIRENVLNA